ncbi:MAG: hypothetical protein DRI98_10430 [Bacteroidetes bacterium]|nr:MAG: hypothetical protein DRI98_10430 [Bacteroidota bacterium]
MFKLKTIPFLIFLALFSILEVEIQSQDSKPRVVVMTDGEVDDRSSMIRFLLYSNDVELLAIIETNSVYQREGHSNKDWYDKQVNAYEEVHPNLIKHDSDYPTADQIRALSYVGDEDPKHIVVNNRSPERRPGMEPQIKPDDWADTPGSDRIVEILLEEDPRQVYIQAWGGGNTAARAFYKIQTEFPDEYDRAISKAVMHNIWYQDGAGNYIETYHPKVTMLLDHYFNGTWDYGSQSFTFAFIKNEVKNNHGPLGALYPQDYVSEGDSPAFLWALKNGLRNYENPSYGGWGGRYYKVDGLANVYADVSAASYSRWIEAANRDFQTRLDWCVAEKFEDANHKPVIKMQGELDRSVKSGETVSLDASGTTDPDGHNMAFRWWQYQEAGSYKKMVSVDQPGGKKISFVAPKVDNPETIHMILEVRDRTTPSLFSFQRMIITVIP